MVDMYSAQPLSWCIFNSPFPFPVPVRSKIRTSGESRMTTYALGITREARNLCCSNTVRSAGQTPKPKSSNGIFPAPDSTPTHSPVPLPQKHLLNTVQVPAVQYCSCADPDLLLVMSICVDSEFREIEK
jgi:hypothetical protein